MTMRTPTQLDPEYLHRAAWKAAMLGSLNVLVAVLAVRFIVLVAVAGGIALTWVGLAQPDTYKLGLLAIYASGVVIPVVWLSATGRG